MSWSLTSTSKIYVTLKPRTISPQSDNDYLFNLHAYRYMTMTTMTILVTILFGDNHTFSTLTIGTIATNTCYCCLNKELKETVICGQDDMN